MDHPKDFWEFMVLEILAWTVVLAILVAGTLLTEQWLKKGNDLSVGRREFHVHHLDRGRRRQGGKDLWQASRCESRVDEVN